MPLKQLFRFLLLLLFYFVSSIQYKNQNSIEVIKIIDNLENDIQKHFYSFEAQRSMIAKYAVPTNNHQIELNSFVSFDESITSFDFFPFEVNEISNVISFFFFFFHSIMKN